MVSEKIETRILLLLSALEGMESEFEKRRKKKDKAKEKFERNGGYSSKHVRLSAEVKQTRALPPKKK